MASRWRTERKEGETCPEVDGDLDAKKKQFFGFDLAIVGTVLVYRPSLKLTAETPEKWMVGRGSGFPFWIPGLCSGAFAAIALGG